MAKNATRLEGIDEKGLNGLLVQAEFN